MPLNAASLGVSLFGNNIYEYLEQASMLNSSGLSRQGNKQGLNYTPLLVSQRVFNGHYPYSSLINTTELSINNCVCGSVVCPFCGGIGAGLNGTLSGNINMRSMVA